MAYTPREIKDRVAVGDDIFIAEDLGNNRIRLIPAPTHVSEAGTPVNKALLQPIEDYLATGVVPVERTITAGNGLSGGGSLNADRTLSVDFGKVVPVERTITAGNGLIGGGSLNTNRTISLGTPSTLSGSTTNNVTDTSHTHAISVATQAEAEAGTDNVKLMTPLRVANALNSIKDSLFPSGGIIMWSGAINDIPVGWALCDGSNGTPDLRDRFIVGAGRDYSVGNTGGAKSVTLNIDQIPSHYHGSGSLSANTAGSHNHGYECPQSWVSVKSGSDSAAYAGTITNDTTRDGSHSHIITGITSSKGGGQAHENRPPYYALCFIMKL